MCRIKTGSQITEFHDVQNIVTAYILRAQQPFSISALSQDITKACAGSKIHLSDKQITELVKDTTIDLLRANYISVNKGRYYARPALSQL